VRPVPDPNEWFHARLVLDGSKVGVSVKDAQEPSLTIEKLGGRREGRVGLFVGNNSGGDFANLRLEPETKRFGP